MGIVCPQMYSGMNSPCGGSEAHLHYAIDCETGAPQPLCWKEQLSVEQMGCCPSDSPKEWCFLAVKQPKNHWWKKGPADFALKLDSECGYELLDTETCQFTIPSEQTSHRCRAYRVRVERTNDVWLRAYEIEHPKGPGAPEEPQANHRREIETGVHEIEFRGHLYIAHIEVPDA